MTNVQALKICHELESHARVGIPRVSTPLDLSLLGAANFLQWVCVNLVLANWSRMGRGCWSSHEQVFNIYIHVQIHNHLYSRYSKFVWMNVCLQNILFVWLSYKWISLSLSLSLFTWLLINNRVDRKVSQRGIKSWVWSFWENHLLRAHYCSSSCFGAYFESWV